ncbi:condensation domain-containing protein, partial [Streptomyces sp. NPDC014734]|uniref:condensation domain-containing protein n=1 Tax=Streptomyces sp. NPDC014734 TaxID=3364886 RepID=UPI00370290A6
MSDAQTTRRPLSAAQHGVWFAHQQGLTDLDFGLAQCVDISGGVDADLFREAVGAALTEAEALRVRFTEDADGVWQTPVPVPRDALTCHDVSAEPDPAEAALHWMREDRARSVDLLADRLYDLALFRLSPDRHLWYTRAHHAVIDGHGATVFTRRVAEIYTALAEQRPREDSTFGTLAALVEEDDAYRSSPDFAEDRAYWDAQLADRPQRFSLSRRTATSRGSSLRATTRLATDLNDDLVAAARTARTHWSVVLTAAVALYAHRMTGADRITLGFPVTARVTLTARRTPGMTANVVPLRLTVGADDDFGQLVAHTTRAVKEALRHQRYRQEDLQRHFAPSPDASGSFGPLVNIMGLQDGLTFGGHPGKLLNLGNGPLDDLAFDVYGTARGEQLVIHLDGNKTLYTADELTWHLARFEHTLAAALAEPDRAVGKLDIVSAQERRLLLDAWNTTAAQERTAAPTERIAELARRTPDAPAVLAQDAVLSYAQLNARANRVAQFLIEHGAGPERTVAVVRNRSADWPVALLAVAKAGAACLVLDPEADAGADACADILEAARAVCVLTSVHAPGPVEGQVTPTRTRISLGEPRTEEALADRPDADITDADRTAPLMPCHPAQVNRSTGLTSTYAALANQLSWLRTRHPQGPGDRVLQGTAPLWECHWALDGGATLVVPDRAAAPRDAARVAADLAADIVTRRITTLHTTPTVLAALLAHLDEPGTETYPSLRTVVCDGEPLSPHLVARFEEVLTGTALCTAYAPVETAVHATAEDAETAAQLGGASIGRPVPGTRVYVLDASLRPAPVGVTGELYVGGQQCARGYAGRPGPTVERLVADPHGAPGERMYRSGDLARWRADGSLELVSHTVECGGVAEPRTEVAAAVATHPHVGQAVAVVREEADRGAVTTAYVVPPARAEADPEAIRLHAAERLGEAQAPTAVVVLDAFPVTARHTLDHAALPLPAPTAARTRRTARNPREEVLCRAFAEVLGVDTPGIDDSFFELGGQSLTSIRLLSRVRTELGVELPVRALFEAPTVARLARRVDEAEQATRVGLAPAARPDQLPLSFAQRRLWFLNRLEGAASTAYNMPFAVRLTGNLDREALAAALRDVVVRHESLRTVFPEGADEAPYQKILDPDEIPAGLLATAPATAGDLPGLLARAADTFDLTLELPLRATLFTLDVTEHVLFLVMHHIAGDGWSMVPLARDLVTAYELRVAGESPDWKPLPVQYADYTLWQHRTLGDENDPESQISRQLAYWEKALEGIPEHLDLPADRPRPTLASHRGESVPVEIGPETHRALAALAQENEASLFMVVQAALAALLSRMGAGTDIPIGTPIAGRTDEALDDLVGFFVNTLVLRTDLSGDPTFRELVGRVRETDLAAYAHQDVPFEHLVASLNPVRSMASHPLFQVMLAFQNNAAPHFELPGLTTEIDQFDTGSSKFDLVLNITELRDGGGEAAGLVGVLEFSTDLFDRGTVVGLVERFGRVLAGVVVDAGVRVSGLEVLSEAE